MKAADANKVEGASVVALLIQNPSFLTDSVACCHWSSFMSTFKMLMRASLRDVSDSLSSELPLHSHVRSVYSKFGILIEFLRKVRASCECRRNNVMNVLLRLSIFFQNALSTAGPLEPRLKEASCLCNLFV